MSTDHTKACKKLGRYMIDFFQDNAIEPEYAVAYICEIMACIYITNGLPHDDFEEDIKRIVASAKDRWPIG